MSTVSSRTYQRNARTARRSEKQKVNLPRSAGSESTVRYPSMVMSPRDQSYFWQKEWHDLKDLPRHIRRQFEQQSVAQTSSPKERQRENNWYEGVVILQGLVDHSQRAQVVRMVRNINERARARDEQDEVLQIEEHGDTVIVKTSENQLAASIARQIQRAFKAQQQPRTHTASFRFSHDEDALRVYWSAPEHRKESPNIKKVTKAYLRKGPKQKRR